MAVGGIEPLCPRLTVQRSTAQPPLPTAFWINECVSWQMAMHSSWEIVLPNVSSKLSRRSAQSLLVMVIIMIKSQILVTLFEGSVTKHKIALNKFNNINKRHQMSNSMIKLSSRNKVILNKSLKRTTNLR